MRTAVYPLVVVGGQRADHRPHEQVRLPLRVVLPLIGVISGGLWWGVWIAARAIF